jgi:hypothetical protein
VSYIARETNNAVPQVFAALGEELEGEVAKLATFWIDCWELVSTC